MRMIHPAPLSLVKLFTTMLNCFFCFQSQSSQYVATKRSYAHPHLRVCTRNEWGVKNRPKTRVTVFFQARSKQVE